MRIAVIGQQAFGRSVLEAFLERGDDVAGVFCAPERPGAKPDPLKLAAEQHALPLFQFPTLKGEAAENALRGLDVDLLVMAYVLQFAPQSFVTIPRFGAIQYHPSLLPKYRGPSSINWPLIKGETETGLTIFRPNDGLDEGRIILQKTVPIGPDDTVGSVYFDWLYPLGVTAMLEAADRVRSGCYGEVVQDESRASYEGWCRDPEAEVKWGAHVDQVHNLIRGCDPSPGAWTMVLGRKVRLYDSRKHGARRFADVVGKPGVIAAIGHESIRITVQGGSVEIFKVRIDGGAKTSAADFCKWAGLEVGASLLDAANPTGRTSAKAKELEPIS